MRLTLRTLLAYLDEILPADEAQQLQLKISESEFAASLVQRIRSSIRQAQSKPQPLDASGIASDANSVAEYLDNTLPVDEVPAFERACFESDARLSEVASCHQILTMVLGTPAVCPDSMRDRVYRLHDENASDGTAGRFASDAAEHRDDGAGEFGENPSTKEVWRANQPADDADAPEYMRAGKRSVLKPVLITAVASFLIVAAVILMTGPPDQSHPLAQWLFATPDETFARHADSAPDVSQQSPNSDTNVDNGITVGEDAPSIRSDESGSVDASTEPAVEIATTETVVTPPEAEPNSDVSQEVGLGDDLPDIEASIPPSRPQTGGDVNGGDPGVVMSEVGVPEEPTQVEAVLPTAPATTLEPDLETPLEVTTAPPVGDPLADSGSSVDTAANNDTGQPVLIDSDLAPGLSREPLIAPPGNAPPENTNNVAASDNTTEGDVLDGPAEELVVSKPGRLISPQELLLRLDGETGRWSRGKISDSLRPAQLLVSLPTYRPKLLLDGQMHCTLVGETSLRLEDTALFSMNYGRVILSPKESRGSTRVRLAGVMTQLDFDDSSAQAAIQVRKQHLPGTNPEVEQAHAIVEVFVFSGTIVVQTEAGEFELTPERKLVWVDQLTPQVLNPNTTPSWINGRDVSNLDRGASKHVRPYLDRDRPVTLSLQELADDRRYDVRALAVRCLAQLDQFDPIVAAMNDVNQRSYWTAQLESIQRALSRSPQTAARLRIALEKIHGPEASELFRMLWGYSEKQLETGSAETLVENLSHELLDYRVVAFENLRTISGGATLTYRPWLPGSRRKPRVARWRERLRNGKIRYKDPPEIESLLAQLSKP